MRVSFRFGLPLDLVVVVLVFLVVARPVHGVRRQSDGR